MVAGSGCVFRYDMDTSAPRPCPNEAGPSFGGYCAEHELENPNARDRCLMQIPPGEPGNEAGTTDLRCKSRAVHGAPAGSGRYCAAHAA